LKKFSSQNSVVLLEIASLTPKEIFLTTAEFTNTTPPGFKFYGHADNSDSIFEYLNILGKSQIFSNPVLDKTQEMPIDEERYFLRFELSGKINTAALSPKDSAAGEEEFEEEAEDNFVDEEEAD